MQDSPSPQQLLQAVARYLRDEAGPALARAGDSALAYQAKVAANMLDIAGRQIGHAPAEQAAEAARLQALIGEAGPLADLNQRLAERIASGQITPGQPGLASHLWQTTLAKLAVDQPGYDTYRRVTDTAPDTAGDAAPQKD